MVGKILQTTNLDILALSSHLNDSHYFLTCCSPNIDPKASQYVPSQIPVLGSQLGAQTKTHQHITIVLEKSEI